VALTPEIRPVNRNPNLAPANTIRPQVGVWYDSNGTPHHAYMEAPPPPGAGGSVTTGATPPSTFYPVTPSDSVALPAGVQSLYVGGTGTLSVRGTGNTTAVSLGTVPAGTTIRGSFSYVMATGTTATNIVAMV